MEEHQNENWRERMKVGQRGRQYTMLLIARTKRPYLSALVLPFLNNLKQ